VLVGCMWHRPVRSEEAELDMFVGERNASEKAPMGGVRVAVIGVVAPAMADDDHLASDG
jgi:hypothetical protein